MIHRQIRRYVSIEQTVDQAVIIIDSPAVYASRSLGNDPRPRRGKAIGVRAQIRREFYIFVQKFIAAARDVAVGAVFNAPRAMREGVPNGCAFAVCERGALYLIGGGRRSPNKFFFKRHFIPPTSYSFFLKAAHLPYFSTAALYSSITFCP